MKPSKLRIVYMGTPEFAVPALDILVKNGYDIAGVITVPDKPAGRGLQMQQSPVKQYALAHGLNVLQPEKLKDPDFLEQLRSLKADLQIVVAFRMLPEVVWQMPPMGTFNLHSSLLPDYRGAAPINRAVMNGETETGVTTFFLQHKIDTGDILLQERIPVGPDETAGELHDRMMQVGADLVLQTVQAIEQGKAEPHPQPASGSPKEAPKIFREDCRIDWQQGLDQVHNHIRGLSPYPAAWTMLAGKVLKIYRSRKEEATHNHAPGTLIIEGDTMKAAVPGGYIHLLEIQLEGKKRMGAAEFLRGFSGKGEMVLG